MKGIEDYYDRKRREAEEASEALRRYLESGERDPEVLATLRERLEYARYTGD